MYWIFISSITPPGELFQTPIQYLPKHPTLESYKFLIENVGLLAKIGNTVLIVGVTLVVSTVLCAMAAYGFSRFQSKAVSIAFAFIIATMLIPEVVTARPLYEFMRKVGLYDTYPGLIILYISAVIPFTVLILRNFVSEIPVSLEEAAAIDGASFSQRLFLVVLPLMKPAIATVCIIQLYHMPEQLFYTIILFQRHSGAVRGYCAASASGQYVRRAVGSGKFNGMDHPSADHSVCGSV